MMCKELQGERLRPRRKGGRQKFETNVYSSAGDNRRRRQTTKDNLEQAHTGTTTLTPTRVKLLQSSTYKGHSMFSP